LPDRAQYDELCGSELGVGDGLLENRDMPLIGASQQMTYLVRKNVIVYWDCDDGFGSRHCRNDFRFKTAAVLAASLSAG